MSQNMAVSYSVLGVYLLLVLGAGVLGAFLSWRDQLRRLRGLEVTKKHSMIQEHFMAGSGLGSIAWFFSMAASLFSGYSVNGIVNEAYNSGWTVTRWIPAGVGVYVGFMWLAPRCHALGKARGYMTMSELIYERYLPPGSGSKWCAHALRLGSFACLQLPIFTYLITQFQSIGREVPTFTANGIDMKTAILVAAGVLLICDLMGGMRAVAYSDVLQGFVMLVGSIIFLIIQGTELGGLPAAKDFWADPARCPNYDARGTNGRYCNMQYLPTKVQIVSYFDFVFRTTTAATMFPHLAQRMFASKDTKVIKRGLASMNFTFFIIQLSSMIMGWTAIKALAGRPGSAFGNMLVLVAERGGGQAFASALLLASAVCAMMSTADSALLAFATMWVRDVFKPYIWRSASESVQLTFGKIMTFIGLSIGVGLSIRTLQTVDPITAPAGKPDLSGLFSLQAVTPIHVVPAVWLGLHWRGLRGEAVAAGMITGLATTLGIVFSDKNVLLHTAAGGDMIAMGLSSSWIGFCVNMFVTVTLGVAYQYGPVLMARLRSAPASPVEGASDPQNAHPGYLDIGKKRDRLVNPYISFAVFIVLLFTVPFYYFANPTPNPKEPHAADEVKRDVYVGNIASWAFVSLFLSGVLAIIAAAAYVYLWEDYSVAPRVELPSREGSQDAATTEEAIAKAKGVELPEAEKPPAPVTTNA